MTDLNGKTILITGGSADMAKATANLAAEYGADVLTTSRATFETPHTHIALELTADSAIETLKQFLSKTNRTIDILVNVAAVGGATLEDTTPEFFRNVFELNTLAAFKLSKFVADELIAQGKPGSIINITTVHASIPNTDPSYSATKAALLALTKSMALKLAPQHIRVNAVSPGAIVGGMNSKLSDKQIKHISTEIPMAKFGSPEDMANAILFLASDAAKYITGQDLRVDGGLSITDASYNR